jgi:hypothetical protein
MDNVRRIGIRAIPDDADIAKFLQKLIEEYDEKVGVQKQELADTIEQTIRNDEPPVFAFAKMLNFLATLEKPELIELLAGLLWRTGWQ